MHLILENWDSKSDVKGIRAKNLPKSSRTVLAQFVLLIGSAKTGSREWRKSYSLVGDPCPGATAFLVREKVYGCVQDSGAQLSCACE